MLRQVRAPCSHGKLYALCRGTVMALIASSKKVLPQPVPNADIFGVESSYSEQSTLPNRFFDALQPSINWLQA
jgi:hypothetical protein